jgi:hypothetical protein
VSFHIDLLIDASSTWCASEFDCNYFRDNGDLHLEFPASYIVIFATNSSHFQLHRISGTVKQNVLNIRLLIRLFSWIHRVVYRLSGRRFGAQLFGAPVLLLTTKGCDP